MLCSLQVYLVASRTALQFGYFRVRRSEKIPAEEKPWRLAGNGDVLLSSLRSYLKDLQCFVSRQKLHSLVQGARPQVQRLQQKASHHLMSFCVVLLTRFNITRNHRSGSAILANFFSHNVFVCYSSNKWIYRTIPVR